MIGYDKDVTDLIGRINTELPILVYPTKHLCHTMRNENNLIVKQKHLLKIKEVVNMGDAGGIGCVIKQKGSDELWVVSLTQLRVKETHPLAKEIKAYQSARIRKLSRQK